MMCILALDVLVKWNGVSSMNVEKTKLAVKERVGQALERTVPGEGKRRESSDKKDTKKAKRRCDNFPFFLLVTGNDIISFPFVLMTNQGLIRQ